MVASPASTPEPHLKIADREDLSDAKLLLSMAEGNLRAALIGNDLRDAINNAERQAEQARLAISRVRARVLGT